MALIFDLKTVKFKPDCVKGKQDMFRTSDLGGKDGQTNHYRSLIRNLAMKICFIFKDGQTNHYRAPAERGFH